MTRTEADSARDLLIEQLQGMPPHAIQRQTKFRDAVRECIQTYGFAAADEAASRVVRQWVEAADDLKAAAKQAELEATASATQTEAIRARARDLRKDAADLRQAMRALLRALRSGNPQPRARP